MSYISNNPNNPFANGLYGKLKAEQEQRAQTPPSPSLPLQQSGGHSDHGAFNEKAGKGKWGHLYTQVEAQPQAPQAPTGFLAELDQLKRDIDLAVKINQLKDDIAARQQELSQTQTARPNAVKPQLRLNTQLPSSSPATPTYSPPSPTMVQMFAGNSRPPSSSSAPNSANSAVSEMMKQMFWGGPSSPQKSHSPTTPLSSHHSPAAYSWPSSTHAASQYAQPPKPKPAPPQPQTTDELRKSILLRLKLDPREEGSYLVSGPNVIDESRFGGESYSGTVKMTVDRAAILDYVKNAGQKNEEPTANGYRNYLYARGKADIKDLDGDTVWPDLNQNPTLKGHIEDEFRQIKRAVAEKVNRRLSSQVHDSPAPTSQYAARNTSAEWGKNQPQSPAYSPYPQQHGRSPTGHPQQQYGRPQQQLHQQPPMTRPNGIQRPSASEVKLNSLLNTYKNHQLPIESLDYDMGGLNGEDGKGTLHLKNADKFSWADALKLAAEGKTGRDLAHEIKRQGGGGFDFSYTGNNPPQTNEEVIDAISQQLDGIMKGAKKALEDNGIQPGGMQQRY